MGFRFNSRGQHPYKLQPGDENLGWMTYQEARDVHRITRGGVDALLLAGRLPWTTGSLLRAFLKGRASWEPQPSEMYYAFGLLLAKQAATRLAGAEPERYVPAGQANAWTRLFEDE